MRDRSTVHREVTHTPSPMDLGRGDDAHVDLDGVAAPGDEGVLADDGVVPDLQAVLVVQPHPLADHVVWRRSSASMPSVREALAERGVL